MKETEWTFKIPDLVKKQIQEGCGRIKIEYLTGYCGNNSNVVRKIITITLSEEERDMDGCNMFEKATFDSLTTEDSFEKWFEKFRKCYKFRFDEE